MLRPYYGVLRHPGTKAFVGAGFLARLPMAMVGLGIVLMVTEVSGSYGLAGLLTAVFAISAAALAPYAGRIVDAAGQHRVLPWLALTHAAALVGLVLAVHAALPTPILLALSAVIGAAQPAVGAMVRARWAALLSGSGQLRTAFALESIVDEIVYIVGPPLATLAVVAVAPGAALLLSAALVTVGSLALALQRQTEPAPSARVRAREPMSVAPLLLIVTVMFGLGVIFGALEIAVVAFADDLGQRAWAGALIAIYAAGSMVAGIAVGARPARMRLTRQWPVYGATLTVTTAALPWISSPVLLSIGMFIAGVAVAPALITGFSLVEHVVPAGRLTEALTWASSGIGLGLAGAAALSGYLVDLDGAWLAFLVGTAGAVICLLGSAAAAGPLAARERVASPVGVAH